MFASLLCELLQFRADKMDVSAVHFNKRVLRPGDEFAVRSLHSCLQPNSNSRGRCRQSGTIVNNTIP